MSGRAQTALVICIVATCAGTVLLYSGDGPVPAGASLSGLGAWHPALAAIAHLLTLPIETEDIADVRDVIPLAGLAAALMVIALAPRRGTPRHISANHSIRREMNPALRWLVAAGGAVVITGILSVIANDSRSLSTGWLVRFAAGTSWAVLVAGTFNPRMVRSTLRALVAVGAIAMILSLHHRESRHLANITWPIGPITPTASMAAVWGALACGWGVGRLMDMRASGRIRPVVWLVPVFIASLLAFHVLAQTGRRGPAIGLLASAALTLAHGLWWGDGRRMTRTLTLIGMTIAAGLAVTFVVHQRMSPNRVAAGAVNLRLEYWRLSFGMIADHLSLGTGPDTFVTHMTNAVAPLRGVSPHVYHGNIDTDAHNEWIQTAVEIGLPGALFWLAVPLGVVAFAWRPTAIPPLHAGGNGSPRRRVRAFGRPNLQAESIALGMALLCIVASEFSGIMMRGPILPIWFWTLIGLLCANSRQDESGDPAAESMKSSRPSRAAAARLLYGVASVALAAVVVRDFDAARPDAVEKILAEGANDQRLFSLRTISLWRRAAEFASARAAAEPTAKHRESAVARWKLLHDTIPGWIDTGARFALALRQAGDMPAARSVLEQTLRCDGNPYEPAANIVFAETFAEEPLQKLACLRRALRHVAINGDAANLLDDLALDAAAMSAVLQEVDAARKAALSMTPIESGDDAGELLRIHAYWERKAGKAASALESQSAAASLYTYLETQDSPYRRGHDAETDVYFALATLLHEDLPDKYEDACRAIISAERYAVLGIRHEYLSEPDPNLEFVGGVVVPTEYPERLRPLWRLSALLHVETGRESLLAARILSYLPMNLWSEAAVRKEQRALYEQAVRDFQRLPDNQRPRRYDELRRSLGMAD